jgi:glycosyltransferase involved in cell wall biosynthesis
MIDRPKPRVLVFIVAYNAEKTIDSVVSRIPRELEDRYQLDILIIDDASPDSTFQRSHHLSRSDAPLFPIHALFNPVNQGYGGNQKLGYRYAIEHGYDFVALLHGDGQYAPECLPELLEPLANGEAAAVFGSRMLTRGAALKGGMPLYKFAGNKILTWIENRILRSNLSEFHSGYRVYSVRALQAIPFDRNSNDFHFDTEIIIQLLTARKKIVELPIPTFYGDEICHVNGVQYAANVVLSALKARLQEWSIFYDRRYDCAPADPASLYPAKTGYTSSHTMALARVRDGSKVLDLGCGPGYIASLLRRRHCRVTGVDIVVPLEDSADEFRFHNLNQGAPHVPANGYDTVLLLDVVDQLDRPDLFLEQLRHALALSPSTEVILSVANVGFIVTRLMLMFGQFNYSKRGILDLGHTRLFTFGSLRRTLEQAGFEILESEGVPAPIPMALGNNAVTRAMLRMNRLLIRLSRGLFAYQVFMRAKARPSLESLLDLAEEQSGIRAAAIEKVRVK